MVARSVSEGLSLLSSGPDYLILDLMLPDGYGSKVLAEVRSRQLPIRVAVTTGSSDAVRLKEVADLAPDVFLLKPIDFDHLLNGLGIGR